MKIITILGTRPEIIRLSRIIQLLDKYFSHILIHTGQNYDYELNEVFFQDLGIRKPDYFLGINTTSLGKAYGDTLIKTEEVLANEKPDAVLILGDTNSSIACIMAKRMKIPIYHMEAGNRCFDLNTPEEINRKIIDHIADFNLVYTEHARRNLLAEGLHPRRIYLSGSPMKEVLDYYGDKIEKSGILKDLKLGAKEYFIISAHREENVDNIKNLKTIIESLNALVDIYDRTIIFSTHPRTRKRLEKIDDLKLNPKIAFLKPFGFFDYIKLQKNALCVISDSGTISEESAILGFPAITIRNAMERPEAIDAGTIIMTGLSTGIITKSVEMLLDTNNTQNKHVPAEYLISNASQRVIELILGTANLSNQWSGIVKNE